MRVNPISANSWQLTRLGLMNCYLVREPDGFTLIDTTVGGGAEDIIAAAKSLGGSIRRILLTHAHADHVGSVDALAAKLPEAQLAANQRTLPLIRKPADKSLLPNEPQESFAGGLPGIATPVTKIVDHGQLYGSLRCIDTPGHIPGHLSFLDERDGTLFAGDALVGVGRLSVCGWTPWYFPLPSSVMWSKTLALDSARSLLDYPIGRFACGHGSVRSGGRPALERAIEVAKATRPQ